MRRHKELMIGISILAPLACSSRHKAISHQGVPEMEETVSTEGMPTRLNRMGEDYFAYDHDGRYYVISRAERVRAFLRRADISLTPAPAVALRARE